MLPLIVVYEVGIRWYAHASGSEVQAQIAASALMRRFFLWFGATGTMLPALAVIGILLAWHIARNDPWTIRPILYMGMVLESAILTAPLIALGMALPTSFPLMGLDGPSINLMLLGLGAGVYEELVFRLIGLTFLNFLLADVLRWSARPALIGSVALSSIAFALYHYWGYEAFQWRSMVFRTLAGIYFAILFLTRGFGISVGVHATYDIFVVLLRQIVPGDGELFS
ncbi:MAG: CPBP family intramembrane metalloprotease [Phycisphaerae bacterium]|nr:CPBP family intramembrane metalloprotease [Phycisphaerae bacterium]MDW8261100.1 CPBP family intramembrane glutamic endopeptidase [Phycisphaerales bacterium]